MHAGAINKMGFNGKKLKKGAKWLQKKAGYGLTAKEEKERRKRRMKIEKTKTAFAVERAKRAKYTTTTAKYKAKARKYQSSQGGSTNRFSQASDSILGGFSGGYSTPNGSGKGSSRSTGIGGIYSPYNLAKERKRAKPKRKRAKPKRKSKRTTTKKRKVYFEYR
tara:strand:+ start:2144 stop:2635 length:492 start_codon:yes stop_codon:yes gene_type:complete